MALILQQDRTGKRCWGCGLEIAGSEGVIVSAGARDILYIHPTCAQSLGQQLFRDLGQLGDLGYELVPQDGEIGRQHEGRSTKG